MDRVNNQYEEGSSDIQRRTRTTETRTQSQTRKLTVRISFGEYFDGQRDRIVADMQTGKNTELYNAWREDYDKRQREKKEKRYRKELEECSDKGVEISPECKVYFKKQFESGKNNDGICDLE